MIVAVIGFLVIISILWSLWSLKSLSKNSKIVSGVKKKLSQGRVIYQGDQDSSSDRSSGESSKSFGG